MGYIAEAPTPLLLPSCYRHRATLSPFQFPFQIAKNKAQVVESAILPPPRLSTTTTTKGLRSYHHHIRPRREYIRKRDTLHSNRLLTYSPCFFETTECRTSSTTRARTVTSTVSIRVFNCVSEQQYRTIRHQGLHLSFLSID